MKASILAIFFVAIIGIALGSNNLRDGRPGCATDIEMRQVYYRNFWDANAYWKCINKGVPASPMRCEEGGYQGNLRKCVDWEDWEWEDPVAPPSSAY
ncbi:uncharacterized protein LOC129915451 [Episyrphus balteatus]|uniref:uncharacterized protein LOC129915451 n=1 Tax=Episyrphus balteatus TaxID=286459 RepID=UPI00248536BB|nr:uncharacterized protein LOC129915451 [Episyrphus balteatus]